ncbi:hypothetical protein [Stenotrophomonas phage RAS14]
MSYIVKVNGKTTTETSYNAAGATVKASVARVAASLREPLRKGLYRSPKAQTRANAERLNRAVKLEAAKVTLPKAAGDAFGKLPGFTFAIARR